MLRDIILSHNYRFTNEEKEKCLPVVMQISHLADIVRYNGIFALEEEIRDESKSYSVFLKNGIELIVDGRDPSWIESIFENLILWENHTGAELLEKLMIAQGVFMLQQGDKPYVIRQCMLSFLGETFMKQMSDDSDIVYEKYFTLLHAIKDKKTLPECIDFANYIKTVCAHIGSSLRWIFFDDNANVNDSSWIIMYAIRGCGSDVIYEITKYMTLTQSIHIFEERLALEEKGLKYLEVIINAQKRVLNYLKDLDNSGYIMLPEYEESLSV